MKLLIFSVVLLASSPALAHDYWLAPEQLFLQQPRPVDVSLFVGERLVPETEKAFERARYPRAELIHDGQSYPLVDEKRAEGTKPIFEVTPRGRGGHLMVVDRNASQIELAPNKFENYLRHEGLEPVIAARAKAGESKAPGRERYSRSLKALVQVGDEGDTTYATRTQQKLELIPESNPAFALPGDRLVVHVEFQGKPLANAKLSALSRTSTKGKGQERSYRTDEDGRVSIEITQRGFHVLRLVHMVRCIDCDNIDWESFWTAYSFANTTQ